MKKVEVGRRFFRHKVPEELMNRIKNGESFARICQVASMTGELEGEEFDVENLYFNNHLKGIEEELREFLTSRNLPADPIVYFGKYAQMGSYDDPSEEALEVMKSIQELSEDEKEALWDSLGIPKEDRYSGINLDGYIICCGYDFDSLEYIAGKLLFLIDKFKTVDSAFQNSSENTNKKNFSNLSNFYVFWTGFLMAQFTIYSHLDEQNKKGGKNKSNPFRIFGQELVEQYPGRSSREIWEQLFRSATKEARQSDREAQAEGKEVIPTSTIQIGSVSDWDILADLHKNKLLAQHSNRPDKTITFNGFRRYLSQKS